jgi:hypothetical protein
MGRSGSRDAFRERFSRCAARACRYRQNLVARVVGHMGERLRHLQAKADEISDETPRTRRCPTCSTVYLGTRPHCSSACARNEPRDQRHVTRTSLNKGGSA